jgi:sulfate adenylyltransferase subunit 1 (EFTu-like GTPase family)
MPWYTGPCMLEALDELPLQPDEERPTRFPVQDVYHLNRRRIVVGRVESGHLKPGMLVKSGNSVTRIVEILPSLAVAVTGHAVGLILEDGFCPTRGDLLIPVEDHLVSAPEYTANLFWFEGEYRQLEMVSLSATTMSAQCQIELLRAWDPALDEEPRENPASLEVGEIARVKLRLERPLPLDPFEYVPATGRFIIRKEGLPVGGGIILG